MRSLLFVASVALAFLAARPSIAAQPAVDIIVEPESVIAPSPQGESDAGESPFSAGATGGTIAPEREAVPTSHGAGVVQVDWIVSEPGRLPPAPTPASVIARSALAADPAYGVADELAESPFVEEESAAPPDVVDEARGACDLEAAARPAVSGRRRLLFGRTSGCRCQGASCRGASRYEGSCDVDPCCSASCWAAPDEGPRRFFTPEAFQRRDITLGGWIEQGISVVGNSPADGYNGPVPFNDRDGEYQMNQLYFFLERKVDTGGCGWDLGGRIDFLYGTDARFVECAEGLEANWDQRERFYHAALPQFCLDVGWNDWTVRMGHFYTIMGYEVLPAPDNFFYSHAYTMQYGEPFTHTGMLATRRLSDRVSLTGGFHRGWDRFDDTDGADHLSFLGGANWTSRDGRRELAFTITSGEQGPDNSTVMYSLVGKVRAGSRLRYVIQHDYGQSTGNPNGPRMAEWFGINQYVLFDLSKTWSLGTRIEWFRDKQGVRVRGVGDGNLAVGPYAGDFYEISLGLNWKPRRNLTVRPEVRWDWFHGPAGPGGLPYDAGDRDRQFVFGCDMIVQF
ncbi:MAG: outer membrane beta-barrel protein [Pirellulales bacterium]|nr:outer membrane beta-barrel protein [Pirellulales bacterium]